MKDEGLTVNEMLKFAKGNIIFVDHNVSAKGTEPDPNKVKAIQQMPEVKCVDDDHSNLSGKVCARVGYCCQTNKRPTERENEWVWEEPQQSSPKAKGLSLNPINRMLVNHG